MVRMLAVLRQFDARTDSSSSSTLRKRCSFTSLRGAGSAPCSAPSVSSCGATGKSIRSANWSSRIREASPIATSGVTVPFVHSSITSRSCPEGRLSTWKFTRFTGEKSASTSIALMGSASGSRFSAGW